VLQAGDDFTGLWPWQIAQIPARREITKRIEGHGLFSRRYRACRRYCLHAAENAGPLQGDHHLLHVIQQYVVAGEPRDVMSAKRSFSETDAVTLFRAAMRRMTPAV